MRDLHYNYIKGKYGEIAEILLIEYDSLMYKIEPENIFEDFWKDKDLFDFSNYPKDSKYYNNSDNLVETKMKDETCGVPIKDFEGLKSKMCTSTTEDNHESKKAKDTSKNAADDELKYEDYKNVLVNRLYIRHAMARIQGKGHNAGSYRINEISLSSLCSEQLFCSHFFERFKNYITFFCLTIYNTRLFSQENGTQEAKVKNYYQSNKEELQKRSYE